MNAKLLVIVGPTAIGKTSLSIELAKFLNAEIISADSRQFYREMSIGTAKPDASDLAAVPHHFIDNRSVHDFYSAGDFEREALKKIDALFKAGNEWVIAIGGSGLYLKALCQGLDEMPPIDHELRNELIQAYNQFGIVYLQDRLQTLNPDAIEKLDFQNPQRLMRAIEIAHQGGIKKSTPIERPFSIYKMGLERPRSELYDRINLRVDLMMQDGLLEEVKALHPFKHLNALQTVGYSELFDYFEGKTSLEKAVDLIKQHTRNYAKRQLTWFRADPDINWFKPEDTLLITNWLKSLS